MKNKLKGYRVMAGFTQKEMAEAISMPLQTYIYKESGKGEFSLSEIKRILEVLQSKLKVNINDLI